MNAKSLAQLLKETAGNWVADNAMRLSAALSLYSILSLAPLLVITLKLVALVWRNAQAAREQVMQQMTNLMGAQAAEAIGAMLNNGARHGSGVVATIVSGAVLLFSATGVFSELQDSMNTIWRVKSKPNHGLRDFVRNRLLSMAMVFGIAFLLLVSMFVSSLLTTLAAYIAGDAPWFAFLGDIGLSFVVITLLFAAIFKFLPDVKLAWRYVWLGAAITAGLFILGKYGLGIYFKFAAPTSPFGAAGSLAAVLLWVYYSSFILFFGAEFTKVWTLHRAGRVRPDDNAVMVTKDAAGQPAIQAARWADVAPGRSFWGASGHADERDAARSALAWAIGAFVGGLSAGFFAARKRRELHTSILAAQLHDRLRRVEDALDQPSALDCGLKHLGLQNRIREVQKQIREATSAHR